MVTFCPVLGEGISVSPHWMCYACPTSLDELAHSYDDLDVAAIRVRRRIWPVHSVDGRPTSQTWGTGGGVVAVDIGRGEGACGHGRG